MVLLLLLQVSTRCDNAWCYLLVLVLVLVSSVPTSSLFSTLSSAPETKQPQSSLAPRGSQSERHQSLHRSVRFGVRYSVFEVHGHSLLFTWLKVLRYRRNQFRTSFLDRVLVRSLFAEELLCTVHSDKRVETMGNVSKLRFMAGSFPLVAND